MDPNLVYAKYRDDALAEQFTAEKYAVFVAMPFQERFSYRSREIYEHLIQPASTKANELIDANQVTFGTRRFDVPRRADDVPQTARSIDDDIIKRILFAHVVVADLTFANDGVLLEVGAALALKPTAQIVLITQGSRTDLHFDIRNNAVIEYSRDDAIGVVAEALLSAARHFEEQRASFLTHLKRDLSRDAIFIMNWLGQLETGRCGQAQGLSERNIQPRLFACDDFHGHSTDAQKAEMGIRVQLCLRELLARGLVDTDYRSRDPQPGWDSCTYHATRLGWMFIEHNWDDLKCPHRR